MYSNNQSENEPQVRWYDWLFAFFVADFLYVFLQIIIFAPTFSSSVFASIAAFGIFRLWEGYYCTFRKRQEEKRLNR